MRQKIAIVAQFLRLPSLCILCQQFHTRSMAVCAECIQLLIPLGINCQHCAYPLPDTEYLICGRCIKKTPQFDRALVHYAFEEPLRSLLHQFKYQDGFYLSSFLTYLISQALKNETQWPECLIPVPMHPSRVRTRGFNQAAILTRSLAHQLKLPYQLNACQKIINTVPQASLNGKQRQTNLRKSFTIRPIPYHHVAIIDDLLTTGSTANELALSLKKSGVKQVDLWCCARAIPRILQNAWF